MAGMQGLHEVNVGAGREGRMHFQSGTEAFEVDRGHVLHRDHHMRIAHAGRRHPQPQALHLQFALGQALGTDRQGGGHLLALQERCAHVDADAAIGLQFGHDPAGQGLDLPGAARRVTIGVGQEAGQAADAVAAHLGLGAVGVEDAHPQLTALPWRQSEDHAIGAHPETAITQAADALRIQLAGATAVAQGQAMATVEQQKIVAEALILAELEHNRRAVMA